MVIPRSLRLLLLAHSLNLTHSLTHSLTHPFAQSNSLTGTNKSEHLTSRQLTQLGHEPGKLRFFYGSFGAKVAQGMCGLLAFALCVLAGVSNDFMIGTHSLPCLRVHSLTCLLIGLIIVGVLGLLGYYAMTYSISDNLEVEGCIFAFIFVLID